MQKPTSKTSFSMAAVALAALGLSACASQPTALTIDGRAVSSPEQDAIKQEGCWGTRIVIERRLDQAGQCHERRRIQVVGGPYPGKCPTNTFGWFQDGVYDVAKFIQPNPNSCIYEYSRIILRYGNRAEVLGHQ